MNSERQHRWEEDKSKYKPGWKKNKCEQMVPANSPKQRLLCSFVQVKAIG